MIADALDFRFRTVRLPKDPGCTACAHASGGGARG
jgi:hypothetical protein